MLVKSCTFKNATPQLRDLAPELGLETLSADGFTVGIGVHVISSRVGNALEALALIEPRLGFEGLTQVCSEEFISKSDRPDCDLVAIGTDSLGRCALDGLKAIRRRLREGGVCWIYQISSGTQQVLGKEKVQRSVHDDPFRWIICIRQAERCGFEIVVSCSEEVRTQGRNALGRARVSVAVARLRSHSERSTRLRLGAIDPDRSVEVCRLFNRVFAPAEMNAEHWNWKYSNGGGVAIGAWRSNELIAHYAGVWRDIAIDGTIRRAVQITDVMVSPKERGVMGKLGAFSLIAPSFAECFVGHRAEALIGFGFPNERHFKAAEKRGLYGEVDRIVEIRLPATELSVRRERVRYRIDIVGSDHIRRQVKRFNRLWSQMRDDLPDSIVGVRDHAYLMHRYVNNPLHRYEYAVFRSPVLGNWVGVGVINVSEGSIEIRDVIARPGRVRHCIFTLWAEAQKRHSELKLWITKSHKHYCWVPGALEEPTGVVVPISTWTKGPSVEEIRGRWWLTSGDTDFL